MCNLCDGGGPGTPSYNEAQGLANIAREQNRLRYEMWQQLFRYGVPPMPDDWMRNAMPYVSEERRKEMARDVQLNADYYMNIPELKTVGDLNYWLTHTVEDYRQYHSDSYATFNDIIGALECAKLEFQRRVLAPYEDHKCSENGDVYAPLEGT